MNYHGDMTAVWNSSGDNVVRQPKQSNPLDIICRRWSREAMNWSLTVTKLYAFYFSEGLSCASSACTTVSGIQANIAAPPKSYNLNILG